MKFPLTLSISSHENDLYSFFFTFYQFYTQNKEDIISSITDISKLIL